MAATPPEVTAIFEELLPILERWHEQRIKGEVVIVCGEHQWQPEERPRRKGNAVKLGKSSGSVIVST